MWANPLQMSLVPTPDSDSFKTIAKGCTGIPTEQHCGAFGVQRRHHVHEGVDLYCSEYTKVYAVEEGTVTAVIPFTGPLAGLPWWNDTQAVFVEGASGVVVYGEILSCVKVGDKVKPGYRIGSVIRVLKENKGRPTCMLHLELHQPGTTFAPPWDKLEERPDTLLDPTPFLLEIANSKQS